MRRPRLRLDATYRTADEVAAVRARAGELGVTVAEHLRALSLEDAGVPTDEPEISEVRRQARAGRRKGGG